MPDAPAIRRGDLNVIHRFAHDPATEHEVRLAFATVGEPVRNEANEIANAVLLLHGTTGSGEQFFSGDASIFAPHGAFDPSRVYTIVPDALGHGRSSRASENHGKAFPAYGYLDLIALQQRVLDFLDVKRPMAVVGTSMGGMQAWLWACRPGSCGACVAIACEPVGLHGRNLLWRRVIVNALRDGAKLRHMLPIFAIVARGIAALERDLPDVESADAFIESIWSSASESEKIDVELEFDASFDYAPDLRTLSVPTLAVAFAGDEVNPRFFSAAQRLAAERPDLVQYELVADDEKSDGHQTLRRASTWGPIVERFLSVTVTREVAAWYSP